MNKYEDYVMEGEEESGLVKAIKAAGTIAAGAGVVAAGFVGRSLNEEPIYATVMECKSNGESLGEIGVPSYFNDLTYAINDVATFEELSQKEVIYVPVETDSTGLNSKTLMDDANKAGEGLQSILDREAHQFLSLENLSLDYCTALPGTNIAQHLDSQGQRIAEVERQKQYDVADASYDASQPASSFEE